MKKFYVYLFVCLGLVVLSSCMAQLYIRTSGEYNNSVRSVSLPVDSVKVPC